MRGWLAGPALCIYAFMLYTSNAGKRIEEEPCPASFAAPDQPLDRPIWSGSTFIRHKSLGLFSIHFQFSFFFFVLLASLYIFLSLSLRPILLPMQSQFFGSFRIPTLLSFRIGFNLLLGRGEGGGGGGDDFCELKIRKKLTNLRACGLV